MSSCIKTNWGNSENGNPSYEFCIFKTVLSHCSNTSKLYAQLIGCCKEACMKSTFFLECYSSSGVGRWYENDFLLVTKFSRDS